MAELQVADFLEPRGQLDRDAIWPGRRRWPLGRIEGAIDEYRLQGYRQVADAGVTDADQANELVYWWVHYRAWYWKWDQLSAVPSTGAAPNEGSSSYTQDQINSWKLRADEALAKYEGLLAGASTTPAVTGPGTRNAETSYRW